MFAARESFPSCVRVRVREYLLDLFFRARRTRDLRTLRHRSVTWRFADVDMPRRAA
jgi:hypothetical protein